MKRIIFIIITLLIALPSYSQSLLVIDSKAVAQVGLNTTAMLASEALIQNCFSDIKDIENKIAFNVGSISTYKAQKLKFAQDIEYFKKMPKLYINIYSQLSYIAKQLYELITLVRLNTLFGYDPIIKSITRIANNLKIIKDIVSDGAMDFSNIIKEKLDYKQFTTILNDITNGNKEKNIIPQEQRIELLYSCIENLNQIRNDLNYLVLIFTAYRNTKFVDNIKNLPPVVSVRDAMNITKNTILMFYKDIQ